MVYSMHPSEVVVTGLGVFSPIGIGRDNFWTALCGGRSGIGRIRQFDAEGLPVQIAGEVHDFDPKIHVRPRRSRRTVSRDAQLGIAAAAAACRDAGIGEGVVCPERFGVLLGADKVCTAIRDSETSYRVCLANGRFDFSRWGTEGIPRSFPLSYLKVLPNIIASYISIIHDARGPNNTIHHGEVSSLLAVSEAAEVIRRGAADVMIAGGASSQMHPFDCIRRCALGILSPRQGDPAQAMRPFDADRDGQVWGEGAAVFILESERHARARGADVLARLSSWATAFEPRSRNHALRGTGLRRTVEMALDRARLNGTGLGHVNAHGLSTTRGDRLEARVLHELVPAVPITAPKSYFGNLGAASGAMEMAVSVLAVRDGLVPATLNYQRPDPDCPLHVIRDEPLSCTASPALLINWTGIGQAAAVVLDGPD